MYWAARDGTQEPPRAPCDAKPDPVLYPIINEPTVVLTGSTDEVYYAFELALEIGHGQHGFERLVWRVARMLMTIWSAVVVVAGELEKRGRLDGRVVRRLVRQELGFAPRNGDACCTSHHHVTISRAFCESYIGALVRWLGRRGHLERPSVEERSNKVALLSPLEACAAIATERGTMRTLAQDAGSNPSR